MAPCGLPRCLLSEVTRSWCVPNSWLEDTTMATLRTVSVALPSSQRGLGWGNDRVQSFRLRDRTLGYLFLFPAMLVIVGLVAHPFSNAIVMTFQEKSAGAPGRFIGLANYRELFGNEVFLRTVFNTVVYTAFGVGIKFVLGL